MPLKARTIVDLRAEVAIRVEGGLSISAAAREYGFTRSTVRDWHGRYVAEGLEGLVDRSRAPLHSPRRTEDWIAQRVIAERLKWNFGSKAILQRLREEEPGVKWPARSTIDEIFRKAGLSERRKRRVKRITPFLRPYTAQHAGELLTVDFKGQFRLRTGQLCYPLTMVDAVSRYIVTCTALTSTELEPAWSAMERAFREWGLPDAVQSDNGHPLGAKGFGRLSTISVRLMKLGILPVFSRPAHPQDNGAHERMHRTLKEQATIPPGRNLRDQQRKFDQFRYIYNHERPHDGIALSRPARLWNGARRPFPQKLEPISYEPWFEVKKVGHSGMIKWQTGPIFISHALANELIGLEPAHDDRWNAYFGSFYLGQLDDRTGAWI